MPISKVKASSNPDAMKSEGNDSVDTIIRQAIGKEPFLSFSRTGDSPVQLIQLLHALDQQEPLGWPLLSPLKVQVQKCDKCSKEFCSPINYRRHTRAHHRLKKLDKDSTKNRDLIGAFWDNLTFEDAKEVVSFKNVILEEVPGSSIIKALTTLVHKPGFSALPHIYLKAGSALLDIIEARTSRFLISSQELFSILDDASEKTFLSGSALSMQRYIFDGDAGKIGLESKNLVACTSFLLEQKLIKEWLADKDAEAMRFQKMLVEEEEAAQRRHAELLERKRQKKLRQKEQKAREQEHDENVDVKGSTDEMPEAVPPAETSNSYETCDLQTPMPETPYHITCYNIDRSNSDANADSKLLPGVRYDHCNLGPDLDVERNTAQRTGHKRLVGCRWQLQPKSQQATSNFFLAGQNSHPSKVEGVRIRGMYRDSRTTFTGNKVWSRKHKPESGGESLKAKVKKEDPNELDQMKNLEVVIGSITVSLGDCSHQSNNLSGSCHDCLTEHQRPKNNSEDKPNMPDSFKVFRNRSTVERWRPVSRNGVKGPMPIQNKNRESNSEGAKEGRNESMDSENCPRLYSMNGCDDAIENCSINPDAAGNYGFSNHAAKAFLAQRWKEVIAAEHLKLVLSREPEQESLEVQNGDKEAESHSSKYHKRSIFGKVE